MAFPLHVLRSSRRTTFFIAAAAAATTAGLGCGGGGSDTSTGTFSSGGAGQSSMSTGTGGDIFTFSSSSGSGGSMSSSSGAGGSAACDGNPTTGQVKWAVQNKSDSGQFGLSVASDAAGNVYVTGSYSGTLTLGGKTADVQNASKALFVAKLGADGATQWVRGFAAVKTGLPDALASGRAITVDGQGNVYVLGDFTGQVTFGATTLQCAGNFFGDVFLLKLDAAGAPVQVAQIGDPLATTPASGGNVQTARGIAVKSTPMGDQIAVVGDSQGTLDIGGGKTAVGGGVPAAFLAVFFASSLQPRYLLQLGDGTVAQSTHGVAWDKNNDVLITGNTKGAITFPGAGTLTPAGTQAAFVAKIKGDGSSATWAKLHGSGTAGGEGVAVDGSGGVFITGDHQGDIDFGGGVLANAFGANVYVAKLDGAGNHVWSRSYGDSTSQHVHGIVVDSGGRPVLTGEYSGKLDFGGGALSSTGSDDVFVAKLDTQGCQVWAQSFGDAKQQGAKGIAIDGAGSSVITGNIQGTVMFGATALAADAADLGGDLFVTKLAP